MTTTIKTNKKHIKKNSKYIFFAGAITLFLTLIIAYPQSVSYGVKSGINCCLDVLIPSLFPFMVASSMISLSGIDEKLKFIFGKPAKFLFYLPPCAVPAIIMSLIGGYPVGAYCVKSLYKKGAVNEEQMNRMMCFCVNFGPAFIISALGQMLLNNYKLGIILFSIQVFSSVLIGIILGIIARIKKVDFYVKKFNFQKKNFSFSRILIEGCDNACKSILGVCSLVTLFFGIISIMDRIGVINYVSSVLLKTSIPEHTTTAIILSIIEMTQSCIISAKNAYTPYYIYSWIIGFGGICAHTQIIAQFKSCPFRYAKFLIMRTINGFLTASATFLIIKNPENALETFAQLTTNQGIEISKASPTHSGSIILLVFCIFFTFSIHSFMRKESYE